MQKFLGLFLSLCILLQTALPLAAFEKPQKPFDQKSGWLDFRSNTLRRVAERGEAGAYALYRNPNPAPRNQYERANVHQANVDYLDLYRNSAVYRRAEEIRNAFLSVQQTPAPEGGSTSDEPLNEQDIAPIRAAVAELLELLRTDSEYPIVVQSVLQTSVSLLPLDRHYHFYTPAQRARLKQLQKRILRHSTQCSQGSGYRLFCEGRVEALYGLALLAQDDADAQVLQAALLQDLLEPIAPAILTAGFEGLLALQKPQYIEAVLQKAVEKEEDFSVIDIVFIRFWVDQIQNLKGKYLGKVSQAGVLPAQQKGRAQGNVWENLAHMLAEEAPRQPLAQSLLQRYSLGKCYSEIVPQGGMYNPDHRRLVCKTLVPFLVGALDAGVRDGASKSLTDEARKRHLTPAAYVARAFFEKQLGDIDAETEYRIDSRLHRVFIQELRRQEILRQQALEQNRPLDEQIRALLAKQDPYLVRLDYQPNATGWMQGSNTLEIAKQIADLEAQKVPVPQQPDKTLKMYDRQSETYRKKQIGQKLYTGVIWAAEAADFVWIGLLTGWVFKGITTAVYGVRAVHAGRVTADARRLAALSGQLRKVDMQKLMHLQKSAKKQLAGELAKTAKKAQASYQPKRSPRTGRFPSGLERDAEVMTQWRESFAKGKFSPRDQVEAVAGMKPQQMNNIIEYLYYMRMPQAERTLMKPVLYRNQLPRFMYEDQLIMGTRRLPHGYYKNRFNEKVARLVELAQTERSSIANQMELDNILTSMKDYTFKQGFSFPNDVLMTRGLQNNWKGLLQEILTPGHTPNRVRMNELWTAPVEYHFDKTVSLKEYFSQQFKTAFFPKKSPDFFINSPKWVELENVRRNLAATDYMQHFGKPKKLPWWERVQEWFILGKRSDYLTLEEFGQVMTDQYKRNPAVARALVEAESAPSSLTYRFNCFEGRACQAAFSDGGAAYVKPGYDGTREMFRFEMRSQKNVKVVVFDDPLRPQPRVVDLQSVTYVKDLHPAQADLIRASKMLSDRVDDTWDLLTVQKAAHTLPKIPDLKATIYPHSRLPGFELPADLTGGGANAYLTLFTKEFYPVRTVYGLSFDGWKPVLQPRYYIRKEVPALAGSIHRERLTFLDQVAGRIVPQP